jgi:hypothetical protein
VQHAISFVGNTTDGALHKDLVTHISRLQVAAHGSARIVTNLRIAFYDKVYRTFLVHRGNRTVRFGNSFFPFSQSRLANHHVHRRWQAHDPVWVGELKRDFERV